MSIAQSMSANNEIIFMNRIPLLNEKTKLNSEWSNSFRIIEATGIEYRPKSFFKRNFLKLFSFLFEYNKILQLNNEKKIDWVNVYTQYFGIYFFYFLLSKILHFKVILHYVEFRSKIKGRNILYRINDYFFDNYAFSLCNKVIPISTFLNNRILKICPNNKTIIIPPICDFVFFDSIIPESTENRYLVYCGSANYDEVILFIIESYLKIKDKSNIDLHLIINGSITNPKILELIESNKNKILIFSRLSYEHLIAKYKGSLAQLIPLRDTVQDYARFPQKICEYLASGRPIVTTNFGEIPNYFEDGKNAIVASGFDTDTYSHKLQWVINNPNKLDRISKNSYATGVKLFNTNSYILKLEKFIKT
jgi:glycosyltransferase involved in cell wall biosynthesis